MSSKSVIRCDGCGKTDEQDRKRPLFPQGWVRLGVTGRRVTEPVSSRLAQVDVCSPGCAPKALEHAFSEAGQ